MRSQNKYKTFGRNLKLNISKPIFNEFGPRALKVSQRIVDVFLLLLLLLIIFLISQFYVFLLYLFLF